MDLRQRSVAGLQDDRRGSSEWHAEFPWQASDPAGLADCRVRAIDEWPRGQHVELIASGPHVPEPEPGDQKTRTTGRRFGQDAPEAVKRAAMVFALATLASACAANEQQSVLDPAGAQAGSIHQLWTYMWIAAVLVYAAVMAAFALSVRRGGTGAEA